MKLSPRQSVVLACFPDLDNDIAIETLYSKLRSSTALTPVRRQQQLVGAYVSAINQRIDGAGLPFRIKPGVSRNSYALKLMPARK